MAGSATEARRAYSDNVVARLKSAAKGAAALKDCSVVYTGSFARREASAESDFDYFVLTKDADLDTAPAHEWVMTQLRDASIRGAAEGGHFDSATATIDTMLTKVGGSEDPNDKFTRRMLTLLEGATLNNEQLFDECRFRLLDDVYVKDHISDHQIARFLLNDVVRYWRQIGVDFEFKTVEQGKAWGTRHLKLLFSRKLLYFSGLLMVAETAQRTREQKVRKLLELCSIDPIQRVQAVCGQEATKALTFYDSFLEKMSDEAFRKEAEATPMKPRERHEEAFKQMRNDGQYFSWELERLLAATYGLRHPIHHALIF